jgi:beta-lactamase class A
MIIAGVPVGGLDQQKAAERLTQAYFIPVEVHYGDAVIQIKPQVLGFELDLESMMTAADLQRITQPFWVAYWNYLWNQLPTPKEVPLSAKISNERMREFLKNEIAVRYDQQPTEAKPVPGTSNFEPGDPGKVLDINRAVVLLEDALKSPSNRVVNLTFNEVSSPRPSLDNLSILLHQIIDVSGFDGLTEIYLMDLQTRQELHFAYQSGENISPDVAFTAASTMKIPIMISTYRRVSEPAPASVTEMIELMIERSENDPADRLMEMVMDKNLGPLQLTDDMRALGLRNTFLAGYFYQGAPLLQRIETPANKRLDVSTNPDAYNQTTATEMGMLLDDLYQCSESGGGTLSVVFPGEISQNECQLMLSYLAKNRIGVLFEAGLPAGTRRANKHGGISEYYGLLHGMGDGGVIYTPGGNYILTIYMYHPVQLVFDPVNTLVSNLSRAIYNYFNLSS